MKKATVIVLLMLYTLSSFGIGVRQFYCCGKLKTTVLSIVPGPKKICSGGSGDGCCKTEYQFFKVKDSHFGSQEINSPFQQVAEVYFSPIPAWDVPFVKTEVSTNVSAHGPPLPAATPIYIFNCVYRI